MERRNKKYIIFSLILALTLVVVVTGVLFTARRFKAYCYNHADEVLNARIESMVKQECNNKSIFLVNENALIKKIETEIPSVDVVGIERIFPDAIKVNYTVKKNYAYVIDEGVYKYISKDCRLMAIDGGEIASESGLIRVITPEQTTSGEFLFDKNGDTASYLFTLIDTMERMGFKNAEEMISEIDFSQVQTDRIEIKWKTGALIRIEYPSNNYVSKVQLVVSAITSCEESKRTSGVWTAYADKIAYSEN